MTAVGTALLIVVSVTDVGTALLIAVFVVLTGYVMAKETANAFYSGEGGSAPHLGRLHIHHWMWAHVGAVFTFGGVERGEDSLFLAPYAGFFFVGVFLDGFAHQIYHLFRPKPHPCKHCQVGALPGSGPLDGAAR